MRLNEHTAVSTNKLLLVPYNSHHVPAYHTWMQDPELQAATASEPLSLDEEYEMQTKWRTDPDKLTFILCLPLRDSDIRTLVPCLHDTGLEMMGDVNLFLTPAKNSEDENSIEAAPGEPPGAILSEGLVGELEIMIARKHVQNQGYGRATLLAFIGYVLNNWNEISKEFYRPSPPSLAYLRARINESNSRSIRLFESIGFKRTAEGANYFGELELRWQGSVEDLKGLRGLDEYRELRYL